MRRERGPNVLGCLAYFFLLIVSLIVVIVSLSAVGGVVVWLMTRAARTQ